MGRFDALTQLEEQPKKPTSSEEKNHEIKKSRNFDTLSPTDNLKDKPLKYSTLINASLLKRIKLLAAERDIKDYEVIEIALKEYFRKQK